VTDTAIAELAPQVGVRDACQAVGAAQASYYRRHRHSPPPQRPAPVGHRERVQPRALSLSERQAILDQLHSDRFVDHAPAQVWATLLDEGVYLGSISTFYRLLRQAGETRERRRQATHPATVKPELVATASNQVWSWDITKLRGPAKWTYYHLYVILDIFSRYVVGWMVASRESAALAQVLIRQRVAKQDIGADQLTIHADRGSSMTSKPVTFLLADLGITQSHSPPAHLRRQPVLRGPVQDPEVPARLPRPVRLDRGRPGALPGLLPLVQRGTPPHRAGPTHPRRRPPRHCPDHPRQARRRARGRLPGAPRTVRPKPA
jgi:putative transposase